MSRPGVPERRGAPSAPTLVDTHCHLTADAYAANRGDVLARAAHAGVDAIVVVASDLDDAAAALELARGGAAAATRPDGPRLFSTAGIHPHAATHAEPGFTDRLEALLSETEVVAVGECGLDYHYDFSPRDVQRRVFTAQLELAAATGLPAVVHCREAEADMAAIVREAGAGGARGVLHCFPGDRELLDAALEAGWSVSFTGLVTFRSFDGEDAVRAVPEGRFMLETDGPYLAPAPHRGKRNEPAYLPLIRDRVAEIRGEPAGRVARATTEAARAFFDLPTP